MFKLPPWKSRYTFMRMLPHPDLPACAGCGLCCHLVVELNAVDDVPEDLVVEHDGVRCLDQHADGMCVALDRATRLCTIYERRPQVCRDFARGEPLCRQTVTRAQRPTAGTSLWPLR